MFPDVYADDPGSAIGIVLAEEVDKEVTDQLRRILDEHTALKTSDEKVPIDQKLGTTGKALVTGAEYLKMRLDATYKDKVTA